MPPLTPPVGRAPLYARDPLTGDIYEVGGGGTNEVFIGNADPYVTSPNSTDELWLDTSQTPPILKGRVNNAWVEVTAATEPEVIVGGTIPAPGDDKLWLDPGGVMVPPNLGDPIKSLWAYDGSTGPTKGWHKVEVGGGSEVEIGGVEPTTADWELWTDTSAPGPFPPPPSVFYLPITGGSLTGPLVLAADPTVPLEATTKQYVDGFLPTAGGTMTGPLVLAADPAAPLEPATKRYADGFLPKTGGTMTGPLVLDADPVAPLEPATKQYVDNMDSPIRIARGSSDFEVYDTGSPIDDDTAVYTKVTFPAGLFTGPPHVTASFHTSLSSEGSGLDEGTTNNYVMCTVTISGVSATEATISVYFPEGGFIKHSQVISWMAIE